ncbi:MAG: histidine--tRNA ligase [Clostridia bacterium]|nr:histidine--tRNA ligase [Clostridia bacterium]
MLQRPKGTKDLLPEESYKWQEVETKVKKVLESYNFKEIRVPVFEHTELFQRGVGETTDVVQKEMYTFDDKGGRSITLRPEGTAGVVRAYLENGMGSLPSPVKLWYNMGMYRYENVQKGRLREFHQIGAELIGSESYLADVDVILMANNIFKTLNIPNISLNINSIGCPKCRSEYQKILREFIGKNLNYYCDTCKTRFEKNPMRILDCKEKKCKEFNQGAPMMIDYLCDECKEHFENVKSMLDSLGVQYQIDSGIVRGLDYYTKTVFEFVDEKSGLTALGGGRYDGLVEEFGGQSTPAVGFATGVERIMEMYNANNDLQDTKIPDLYILSLGNNENIKALEISENLRQKGLIIEKDIFERSFKAQMKYADKIKAKNLIVIGENELKQGTVKVKNMTTGDEKEVDLDAEAIFKII